MTITLRPISLFSFHRIGLRVLAAAVLLSCPLVHAQGTTAPNQALQIMQELEQKYSAVQTVQGSFVQTYVDPTFNETLESQAVFALSKPNRFRADYAPPNESTNLVTEDATYRFTKALNQVEVFKLNPQDSVRNLNFMALGFGIQTADVLANFNVANAKVGAGLRGVKLTPKNAQDARFKSLVIAVNAQSVPVSFTMEQVNGVKITATLALNTLQVGQPIPNNKFKPNFGRAQVVTIE